MAELVTEDMKKKWTPILEASDSRSIKEINDEKIAIRLLENQETWCKNNTQFLLETGAATNSVGAGGVATWSPVLIKMAKRLPPMLISMEFFGVQPLATPDGLVFAMRSRYGTPTGPEALFNEANSAYSGAGTQSYNESGLPLGTVASDAAGYGTTAAPGSGTAMPTATAETLGDVATWAQMAVSIEKTTVSAQSRGLYADYTHELRQDMMAVHGQDVDSILSEMLVTEIQAEMNREFIRTMLVSAQMGTTGATPGIFNVTSDTDGRWWEERIKCLLFSIEVEANNIAIRTRRGRGNRLLVSPNVASALAMVGVLEYNPNLAGNAAMKVDPTTSTFAGVMANGMRVHIDPYADRDYFMVGYKGVNEMDSGIFYSPYTPLEMYRTVGQDSFQPRIGFKTRYAISANPFVKQNAAGVPAPGLGLGQGENSYFVKSIVQNLY